MENNIVLNGFLRLPSDLTITPHGISCLPYRLVQWEVIGLGKEKVILKRGRREHIKYLDTVQNLIKAISLTH